MVLTRPAAICLALSITLCVSGPASAGGRHVYLFRGIFNVSTGLDEIAVRLRKSGVAAIVTSHGEFHEVAAAAIRDWKSGKVRSIVLIGHSLGAKAAVSVAEELNAVNIPVALVVTLDQSGIDPIPRNVRRVVNFHVGGSGGLVAGDKGFRGSLKNVDVGHIPGMSHMRVQDAKVMQDRILGLARGG